MTVIRLLQDGDRDAAIRLADQTFRGEGHTSMGLAFPYLFAPGIGHTYGLFEDDQLVSLMGFVPAVVRVGEARLHIYAIGAVCTHPDARGRGYASQLMSTLLAHADAAGASLIVISGDRTLYTRRACYPFGSMRRYKLDDQNTSAIRTSAEASGVSVRGWQPTDIFRLTELARGRSCGYEQSLIDLSTLIKSAAYASNVKLRHQVLVAERNGEAAAFAVLAMSDDPAITRTPFAVEWAGDAGAVSAIFAYAIARYKLDQLQVQVNWHESELLAALGDKPYEDTRNSGLIHLVNSAHLCAQLEPYLQARGESGNQLAARLESLTEEERIALLFDPPHSRIGESATLPVPFPYTVGLNYV